MSAQYIGGGIIGENKIKKSLILGDTTYDKNAKFNYDYFKRNSNNIFYKLEFNPSIGVFTGDFAEVVVKDKLPEGMDFELIKRISLSNANNFFPLDLYNVDGTGSKDGLEWEYIDGVLSIKFTKDFFEANSEKFTVDSENSIFIVYKLKLNEADNAYWKNVDNSEKKYINDVVVNVSGIPVSSDSHQSRVERIEIGNIAKDGRVIDKGDYQILEYDLILNPSAKDLNPNSDVLTFTDTINIDGNASVSFEMIKDSIKIYEYSGDIDTPKTDKELEYITFKSDGINKLTFTLQDEKAMVLTYQYKVKRNDGFLGFFSVSNSGVLEGFSAEKNGMFVHSFSSAAGLSGEYNKITINKADEYDYAQVLPNANFALDKYVDGNWVAVKEDLVTNDQGRSKINMKNDYSAGILYRIREIQAPEGYIKSDNYIYFTVMLKNNSQQTALAAIGGNDTLVKSGVGSLKNLHFIKHVGESIFYYENKPIEKATAKIELIRFCREDICLTVSLALL